MLQAGIIQQSTSLWASPIALVNKKDGGVHFGVDFQGLNQIANFDAYRVEEVIESVGSATIVSSYS